MPGDTDRQLRAGMIAALRESDPQRRLDSLETVVVMTFLTNRGIAVPGAGQQRPDTIEGWVRWAGRLSSAS
ncbi:MAG TPA: hypothetical protein VHF06_14370 [Pseudonocardiaceae bacterium]|jgi:hypothetical protein|nr:hypothetical protein [Pseudonocardiaceae bacterium]